MDSILKEEMERSKNKRQQRKVRRLEEDVVIFAAAHQMQVNYAACLMMAMQEEEEGMISEGQPGAGATVTVVEAIENLESTAKAMQGFIHGLIRQRGRDHIAELEEKISAKKNLDLAITEKLYSDAMRNSPPPLKEKYEKRLEDLEKEIQKLEDELEKVENK
jgi:hypothetical protein